jgi:hypothetical protein
MAANNNNIQYSAAASPMEYFFTPPGIISIFFSCLPWNTCFSPTATFLHTLTESTSMKKVVPAPAPSELETHENHLSRRKQQPTAQKITHQKIKIIK